MGSTKMADLMRWGVKVVTHAGMCSCRMRRSEIIAANGRKLHPSANAIADML